MRTPADFDAMIRRRIFWAMLAGAVVGFAVARVPYFL